MMKRLFTIVLLLCATAGAFAFDIDVTVTRQGMLEEALVKKTSDLESIIRLTVHGPLSEYDDLGLLGQMTNLEELDLSDAQVEKLQGCIYLLKLRKIVLGESTTEIDIAACMFCPALTEITMPAVEILNGAAFSGCTALKTITLPSTLSTVGQEVFQGCTALKDVYCYTADYDGSLFSDETSGVTLHVHKSLVDFFRKKEPYAGVTIQGMDFLFPSLLLNRPTTLTDITAYQGADISFKMGEVLDMETMGVSYAMGALNLDAPASPKWKVGKMTLPVDYHTSQTNFNSEDFSQSKEVFAIASFVNQRTDAEAESVEVKLKGVDGEYWTFFSVPFDVNVNDIRCARGKFSIRRYAGQKRAEVRCGETWEEVKAGEQLRAFEGYLFQIIEPQTGEDDEDYSDPDDYFLVLPAAATANKQNVFATGDVVVPLKKYPAERPHNADWNLVGNPYPCYYELSGIKEHVDVYFFKNSDEGYVSMNTADGQGIFLAPNATFFVQATDVGQLTFQASGRRLEAPYEEVEVASGLLDPAANFFNPSTLEAYFDLFTPGALNEAEFALLKEDGAQSVKILTVVAPMGERDLYFTGYSNVVRIDLGQSGGFTSIPSWAFAYMSTLQEVVLPASVMEIDDDAFLMSSSLEKLTIYATTPPTITSKVFHSMKKENLVVLVPKEAVATYKAAEGWKDLNIQPIGGGGEELQNVSITVRTPDGQDFTSQCNILWRDASGNQLAIGNLLEAQPVGSTVTYNVTLPAELTSLYEPVPETSFIVQASGNLITINLIATGVVDLGSRDLRGSLGTISYTLQPAEPNQRAVLEIADVQLAIKDKQTGEELTDFVLLYPNLQFEQTRLNEGQVVILSASSRSGCFENAQVEAAANVDGDFTADFIIKERGHARITCTRETTAAPVNAFVFDDQGHFVKRFFASGNIITVKDLPDGTYTAVVMEESQYFGVVASLSDLGQTQLREGTDYAQATVQLEAGATTAYTVSVPVLDTNRLCHTSSESYIVTNNPSIASVNSATLKAKVVFKDEYAASVSNLRLIITFPEGTGYVDNSLLMTQSDGSHQFSNQRLIVPCQPGEQVRFCMDASTAGMKSVSAMVQYNLGGQQYTQPIGAATIEVENEVLDICEITDTPTITVEGYLLPMSHVIIYDGTTKVAEYNTNIIGYMKTEITLNPAYNGTYHNIYATSQRGNTIRTTETSTVYLDNSASILTEVSMIYQGQCLTWHPLHGSLKPDYYSVNPTQSGVATFVAKLKNPQPQNILGPEFYVYASDGSGRTLPATWDEGQQAYTATFEYTDENRLPVLPFFFYDYANPTPPEREDIFEAEVNYIQSLHNQLVTDVDELVNFVEIIKDEEDEVAVDFTIGNNPTRFRLNMKMEDYNTIDALRQTETFTHTMLATDSIAYNVDGDDTYFTVRCIDFTNHYAYSTTICYADPSAAGRRALPRRIGLPSIPATRLGKTKFVSDLAGMIDEIKGYVQDGIDLMWSKVYLDQMQQTRDNHQRSLAYQIGNCQFLLWAMCSNNTFRVPSELFSMFQARIASCEGQNETFIKQLDGLIDAYLTALRNRIGQEYAGAILSAGAGKLVKVGLSKGLKVLHNVAKTGWGTFAEVTGLVKDGAKNTIKNAGTEAFKKAFPTDFMGVKNYFEKFAPEGWQRCAERNMALADEIVASYKKCEEDPGEIQRPRRKRKGKRSRPIVDPSGYVYEGVEDNRVEGVTATIYYKENESAAEQLWDAAEFGQENPLTTDAAGLYMWNVPQGLWQVRFQKEGYQPTQTAWLPVPPPQLEITVPMTQTTAPAVVEAAAYADAVSIRFSQYMQVASLSDITVKQNNIALQGALELLDGEGGLARTVRFLPSEKLTARSVQLTVPATAKSYSGTTLPAAYTATLEVQYTIEGLVVQDDAAIELGQTGYVTVTAYPAVAVAGKTLSIEFLSPILELAATKVTFDDNGQALVPLRGLLPGVAEITFGVGDLQARAAVEIKYHLLELCSRPVASIASGVIAKGTKVELYTATKGATIYYTTDGSCPCDEATRKRYTEPIVIQPDVTIQAIAVLEGMTDSEVTTLTYTIGTGVVAPEVIEAVVAEDFYYNLNGTRVMPPLPRGTFIHVQRTPSGQKSRKVRVE